MGRRTSAILLLVAIAGFVSTTAKAEPYDPSVLPRDGIDFYNWIDFTANYGQMDWEIKNMVFHQDGFLGTFNVGETINMGLLIGVVGDRPSLNAKSAHDPIPTVWIYEDGSVRDYYSMNAGSD